MNAEKAKILQALSKAGPVHIDDIHADFHQAVVDFSTMDPPLVSSFDGRVELTCDGRMAAQRLRWGVPA